MAFRLEFIEDFLLVIFVAFLALPSGAMAILGDHLFHMGEIAEMAVKGSLLGDDAVIAGLGDQKGNVGVGGDDTGGDSAGRNRD